ncbi:MAG TPA: hypothetical protein VJI71_01055 [Candidatus Norongarragalinales archaeon]|nr:hypothetical protein [Candidatus Norongarragalinales archaeon]
MPPKPSKRHHGRKKLHPPMPPHLRHEHPPHPPLPPHEKKKINYRLLGESVLLSSAVCLILGIILFYSSVAFNVILPALAPVWVGGITLWYSNHSRP